MKKYERTIKSAIGSCDTELFKKMVQKGDVVASKIDDYINQVVKITGYADVHIATDDKEFDVTYYATDEGYFSTGSVYFNESLTDYLGDTNTFKILKVKTKKGFTYKASPIFNGENEE